MLCDCGIRETYLDALHGAYAQIGESSLQRWNSGNWFSASRSRAWVPQVASLSSVPEYRARILSAADHETREHRTAGWLSGWLVPKILARWRSPATSRGGAPRASGPSRRAGGAMLVARQHLRPRVACRRSRCLCRLGADFAKRSAVVAMHPAVRSPSGRGTVRHGGIASSVRRSGRSWDAAVASEVETHLLQGRNGLSTRWTSCRMTGILQGMTSGGPRGASAGTRGPESGRQLGLAGVPRLPGRPRISLAVQDVIKAFIVEKRLRPADPLPSETELAEHLGVSRNSVREAVKALQAVGLVEARVGAGLFVGAVSMDSVIEALVFGLSGEDQIFSEALDARCMIESGLAEAICEHVSPAQIRNLRRIVGDWSKEAAAGRYTATRDGAFHNALTGRASNHLIGRFLDTLWGLRARARQHGAAPEPPDPIENCERHRRILRALEIGDVEQLRKAIEAHYAASHQDLEADELMSNPTPDRESITKARRATNK